MFANITNSINYWFRNQFLLQKFDTPLGYVLLGILAAAVGYLIPIVGLKGGGLLFTVIIGIPILGGCLFNHMFGICVTLSMGVLIGLMTKIKEAPYGIAMDGLLFVMFFGLLIQIVKDRDFSFAKSPISAIILVWVFYNIIQVLNPEAWSRTAWIFTVRTMAVLVLLYFIVCNALNSYDKVKFLIKFIIGIGFLSALYGLKQEYLGFFNFEMAWLRADEERYQLIVQWSRTRIFSFFSDPTTYGIVMSYMATFCGVMMFAPMTWAKRAVLGFVTICMTMAMAFAGSRTPFVLMPFGIAIFVLMSMRKEVIVGALIMGVLGAGFVLRSTNSAVIYRIQSAFVSSSDDTMQVRKKNQLKVRPYIYSHPFGAGLGSTGIWGKRFTPDRWLSQIAHDSSMVRIAVELGTIGLLIFALLLIIVIRTGVYYYLRVEDPFMKVTYMAITVVVFQLTLASYPQEAIPILPTSLIFYCFLGILVRFKDFDVNFQKEEEQSLYHHVNAKSKEDPPVSA